MTDLINQLIKYEAAYRTAPATPGLLIIKKQTITRFIITKNI